jgi:hypothetical protein
MEWQEVIGFEQKQTVEHSSRITEQDVFPIWGRNSRDAGQSNEICA